jgi:hypothetical protein
MFLELGVNTGFVLILKEEQGTVPYTRSWIIPMGPVRLTKLAGSFKRSGRMIVNKTNTKGFTSATHPGCLVKS